MKTEQAWNDLYSVTDNVYCPEAYVAGIGLWLV
jgi:hypothetical protein